MVSPGRASRAPSAPRICFLVFARFSIRARLSCPLLGAPPALKGASRTRPCRADNFANVVLCGQAARKHCKTNGFSLFFDFGWTSHFSQFCDPWRAFWASWNGCRDFLSPVGTQGRPNKALMSPKEFPVGAPGAPCWRSLAALFRGLGPLWVAVGSMHASGSVSNAFCGQIACDFAPKTKNKCE